MLVPVRCFTCGKLIADKYSDYQNRIKTGEDPKKVLDELGMERYCCRRMLLTTVETIQQVSKITAISGRVLYNSRGSKTIEVDVVTDEKFVGRVCAPSGASVGKFEAVSFPNNNPEESLSILNQNSDKFIGIDASDLKQVHDAIHSIDETESLN